jgi:hypothetical protein
MMSDFFQVQLHLQSDSYVSAGEILTAPPDVKYSLKMYSYAQNRVLAVIRLDSGRDPRTLRTHRAIDSKTQIHS